MFILFLSNNIFASAYINMPVGRDEIYSTNQDIASISIGNKDLIEVTKHGNRRLSVHGKKIGSTTLSLYSDHDSVIEKINIKIIQDLPSIRHAINNMFADEKVGIDYMNDSIVLTGKVSSEDAAQKILHMTHKISNEHGSDKIVNLMKTSSNQQVMLRVRVGEIKKNATQMLGSNLSIKNEDINSKLLNSEFNSSTILDTGLFQYQNAASLLYKTASDIVFKVMLSAMQTKGLFKVLAEPNLVAISGQSAKFHAGTEIAIPTAQSSGVNTTEFKPVGVSVSFTPTVLSNDRIRILVEPEVSEISKKTSFNTPSVAVGNVNFVPDINVRKASTTVELAPGESFMIAGLIKNEAHSRSSSIPYTSRIPVIGSLFKAADYAEESSELVISITPYIVNPVDDGDIRLPVDDYQFPSALQAIIMGNNGGYRKIASKKHSPLEGPYGYIMD
ncbi:type II and III secretion system protein family protein [Candidatus Xenohaliotis californiensis]